jgi:hypothetical protein
MLIQDWSTSKIALFRYAEMTSPKITIRVVSSPDPGLVRPRMMAREIDVVATCELARLQRLESYFIV